MILCVYSHKNRTRVGSDHNVDNPVLSWAKSIGSNHIRCLLILPTLYRLLVLLLVRRRWHRRDVEETGSLLDGVRVEVGIDARLEYE